MTKKNMWVAGVATPVMIAMLLLFAGSPSVKARMTSPPRQTRR